jgi:4-hydroxy-3-methylbut-2-enyl diphosphate reductase IspH
MLGPTIKLNKDLWDRVKKCAGAAGYSSPEEFVEHVLAKLEDACSDEEIVKSCKGLGYID